MNDKTKKLISENPTILATSQNNIPNIAVATDVTVLDDGTILIAHNEMRQTIENIKSNVKIALLILDKNYAGVRIFGKAHYYTEGRYFDLVNKLYKNATTDPLGAILITVDRIMEIK
ncbi:MAG: pyridoxamine 5'-phosphate oxidase family protein [Candidatus Nomurabacteria bacterium]|jgi:uncharacterized pyridoxamine 5'-phosphate oxidase family protein|nr:pyridoxamine 5'-phosphate oxidase family protein [Candidatus Nomurabacteria bacterium]